MAKYEGLNQFTGVFLSYDWPEDWGSEPAAVDGFARDDPEMARLLIKEIDEILAGIPSEAELNRLVYDQYYLGYLVESEWPSIAVWLRDVQRRLTEKLAD